MNLIPDQPLSPSPETLTGYGKSEEDLVMSEVHLGCPPFFSGPHLSRFTFSLPPEFKPVDSKCIGAVEDEKTSTNKVGLDEDGDLVITRRCTELLLTLGYGSYVINPGLFILEQTVMSLSLFFMGSSTYADLVVLITHAKD